MADARLRLALFGTFHAEAGEPVAGFRTDKVRALLAYLAVEDDRPHSRSSLATLLWPDMPDETALRNLRKTLHRLREALSPSLSTAAGEVIHASRRSARLDPELCTVDVAVFGGLLQTSATHPHRHLHLCTPCLERLSRAAALYRGELLAGFGLPDAEPFEEWLLLKREFYQHQALGALHQLAAAHLDREEYDKAYTYAARQVELDPGREEAHRQVIRALALGGQRAEALAYVERARRMLLDTLGVEPAAETVALAEGLRATEAGGVTPTTDYPVRVATRRRDVLPAQLTPFVGRTAELLRIADHLRDPECRVVTIIGPGGTGKTRLAVRAAEGTAGRARFADGVIFISLTEVRAPEDLPAALVSGLGLQLDGHEDPRAQLLNYLATRDCLLVLDNLEHLLGGVDLLVDILTAAPGVRLLVTSRLPLGLQAEHRVPLEGLDYPGQFDAIDAGAAGPLAAGDIADCGSVQLFVQAARRVEPSFSLSHANERAVLDICRLVGGMPLALELAAPWIRAMDCAAIAAAIRTNLELLATEARDVPVRQRSVQGVFAQSWRLLTPRRQAVLARLSVFRGPFDMNAAGRVAGAAVLDLASVLDMGLLHRGVDGRYRLHELLRQFSVAAGDSLPDLDLDTARDRHCDYYLGLAAAAQEALHGQEPRAAVASLQSLLPNLQEAWRWAAERGRLSAVAAALDGMARFWELTAGFEAAEAMLAGTVAALPKESDAGPLRVRLLVWQAHFHEMRSRLDDALLVARSALDLALQADDLEGAALARSVAGEILPHRGEFDAATTELEAAYDYFEAHGPPRRLARALSRLGTVYWRAGDYVRAADRLGRARDLHESLGDDWEVARASSSLAGVAFESGELVEAQVRAEAALHLYELTGDRRNAAAMRGNLALVYRHIGQFEQALRHNAADLQASRDFGDRHEVAIALGNRASILVDAGMPVDARDCYLEAIHIEEALGNAWDVARHRAGLAHLLHVQGELDLAVAHFGEALPVLRAHDARYYRVIPLLDAAELQLDRGQIDEAEALIHEGGAIARELDLGLQVSRSQALEARLAQAPRGPHGGDEYILRPTIGSSAPVRK